MGKQSFTNHIRYYTPHHFVFYPIMVLVISVSLYRTYFAQTSDDQLLWAVISIIAIAVAYLSYMVRQHYALTLQDRIIRLELRYRYFSLTGKKFEPIELQLRDSQLFALRFCPDSEFEALVERILAENLSEKKIKKAIMNWKGDFHRV
ncbi:MAG TPA: DUF6526 family protein [Flavobacterium sp.]|nr:DUF6526 family protein [Flavobacterium sp.]